MDHRPSRKTYKLSAPPQGLHALQTRSTTTANVGLEQIANVHHASIAGGNTKVIANNRLTRRPRQPTNAGIIKLEPPFNSSRVPVNTVQGIPARNYAVPKAREV